MPSQSTIQALTLADHRWSGPAAVYPFHDMQRDGETPRALLWRWERHAPVLCRVCTRLADDPRHQLHPRIYWRSPLPPPRILHSQWCPVDLPHSHASPDLHPNVLPLNHFIHNRRLHTSHIRSLRRSSAFTPTYIATIERAATHEPWISDPGRRYTCRDGILFPFTLLRIYKDSNWRSAWPPTFSALVHQSDSTAIHNGESWSRGACASQYSSILSSECRRRRSGKSGLF